MKKLSIVFIFFGSWVYPMQKKVECLIDLPREIRYEILNQLAHASISDKDKAKNIITVSKVCKLLNADVKNSESITQLLRELKQRMPVRPSWKNAWGVRLKPSENVIIGGITFGVLALQGVGVYFSILERWEKESRGICPIDYGVCYKAPFFE